MSDYDSPGVTDRTDDLGPALAAWRVVPSNPTDLATELHRKPPGSGLGDAALDEHQFEAFIRTTLTEVFENRFGRRSAPCFGPRFDGANRRGLRSSHWESVRSPA